MHMFKKIFKITSANIITIYLILLMKSIIIDKLHITSPNIIVIVSVMTYLLGYVILFSVFKFNYKRSLMKLNFKMAIIIFLIAIVYVLLINFSFIGQVINILPGKSLYSITNIISKNVVSSGIYGCVIVFFITVIIAPVCEELIYRGIILSNLMSKYSVLKSIIISASAFAIFHLDLRQGAYAFIFSIISGFLYTKTQNVKSCILLHSIINLINFLGIFV